MSNFEKIRESQSWSGNFFSWNTFIASVWVNLADNLWAKVAKWSGKMHGKVRENESSLIVATLDCVTCKIDKEFFSSLVM
jgi:hypothetical protein